MRTTDARKLSRDELTKLRERAVTAVQYGEHPDQVARIFGIGRSTLYGWLAKYRQGGWGALDAKKRGGRPSKLDAPKLRWLYETVATKDPRQFKFKFALWTSRLIRQVIARELGIELSKASVCRLLAQLGLSPQKPLWRAYQQDPTRVERWLSEEFPQIRLQARYAKAQILFADEAGVRSDAHRGTTWAKRGQTPVISTTGARFGVNLISAISARGEMRFMLAPERVNAAVFIEFLDRLLVGQKQPVYLIVDGHPVHRSKKLKEHVERKRGMLRLFHLPSYSPQLNPDELVWNDLKRSVGQQPAKDADQLRQSILSHMRSLQKRPERIKSFFQAPDTHYAAEP